MKFKLNQIVETPLGLGLVQGQVNRPGEEPRVVIAYAPSVSGEWVRNEIDWRGFWILRHVAAGECKSLPLRKEESIRADSGFSQGMRPRARKTQGVGLR